MRIKIHGGTPVNDGENLCGSCRHSRITRGRRVDEEIICCEASPSSTIRVLFKVTSCSEYSDQSLPTYWDFLHEAWILRPQSGKRPAGFVRASELRYEDYERCIADLQKCQNE
jgi:hypothetical protein